MTDQPSKQVETWDEPASVRWTSPYLKRLLIERHQIRARLENPGGSVIVGATRKLETEQMEEYSSVIGNTFHVDLIDAMDVINGLDAVERDRLLAWCDGLPSRTAAEFASVAPGTIRKRGQRIARKVVQELNDRTVTVQRVA